MARFDPAPRPSRRRFLLSVAALAASGPALGAPAKRLTIAFANITDDPSRRLEGTGFTGADVRDSFPLAARKLPIELVLYDNNWDPAQALANADDAARRGVNAYVLYGWDEQVNAQIGGRLAEAKIPVLAINQPVPDAPLYTADNEMAGRLAGAALARFAQANWPEQRLTAAIVGPAPDRLNRLDERARGIAAGLAGVAEPIRVSTDGTSRATGADLRAFLDAHARRKLLIAALEDATALAAKDAVEEAGRQSDVAIVGQGCDRTMHGNVSDKRPLDPINRGSALIGSVAFFLDRYGYDILPLAVDLASGKQIAERTTTQHQLVTPANVFVVYPPIDMN